VRRAAFVLFLCAACQPFSPVVSPLPPDAGSVTVDDAGTTTGDAGTPADAGADDAGLSDDAGTPPVDAGTRCEVTSTSIRCEGQRTAFTTGGLTRDVFWQTPTTPPPANGYPVVLLFQGSFFPPSGSWNTEVSSTALFGGYYQAKLQAELLAHGFTVIAPTAAAGVAWQTNNGFPWDTTTDKTFVDGLLVALGRGDFGPIDSSRRYATGISSGGYMTSRMALSYAGQFRALAIQSASWATCAGAVCFLPTTLPVDHPPTLLLHGRLDVTVPLFTAQAYASKLTDEGFTNELVIDDAAGHEWLPVAPARITAWFETH